MRIRFAAVACLLPVCLAAAEVRFKERCLKDLVSQVPKVLESQDKNSGRFGTGIWIVTDQNVMLALAAAWSTKDAANPYFHSPQLLNSIMSAGDALIDDMDADGKWEFRKKDGSKWGKILMPWIYSRWIRSYALVRDAMPADRRAKWDRALRLGYGGISAELAKGRVHNIPSHHAMGLYFAGKVFNDSAWTSQASDFLGKVAASQHPDGYWSEHKGPVVLYGFVYVDALGTYFALSGDKSVLPVLRKSAIYHAHFTYPDGTDVETIDERNPYHDQVRIPNPGFTCTPEGRSYVARQLASWKKELPPDEAALLLLYGREGPGGAQDPTTSDFRFVLGKGDAMVWRQSPWFLVASAITAPIPTARWQQDRQNFVSIFHEKAGLVLGGGNTKLQPGWSNFTIGDESLLFHRPGDEKPNFVPPPGLIHVPVGGRLADSGRFGVELDYGKAKGTIAVKPLGPSRLEYTLSISGQAATAHVTILPRMTQPVRSSSGQNTTLAASGFEWRGVTWIEHGGIRCRLASGATVRWPVLPHNPYTKDGHAEPAEGRIAIDVPLSAERPYKIILEVQ